MLRTFEHRVSHMRLVRNRIKPLEGVLWRRRQNFRHFTAVVVDSPATPTGDRDCDVNGEQPCPKTPSGALLVLRSLHPSLRRTSLCNDILRSLLLRSADPRLQSEAMGLLRDMLRSDSPCPADSTTCSIVFSSHAKRSCPIDGDALVAMAKMGFFPEDAFQSTQLVNKLCRTGGTAKAWDFVHAVKDAGGTVEASVCNALLTGLARDRDFRRMNLLFSQMKEMGVRPTVVTYSILINHLCKCFRLDEAMQVLDVMTQPDSGVKTDTITFNTIIDGFCKAGRLDDALVLLDRMKDMHETEANTATYNCLIDGFCKAGELDKARDLADRMEREQISPDVITLNTLISGMCRHGMAGRAISFFRKKQVEWAQIKGNSRTYSIMIGAFLHSNNVGKAMDLFDEMVEEGHSPDSVVYFTFISGLTQMGRMEDACSVASHMRANGFQMDVKSYNCLISGFCKKKRLDKAHDVLREMKESGFRPDVVTYNTFIAASAKVGDFSSVDKLLNEMVEDGLEPSVITYGALINGFCKAGNIDEAFKIFQSMSSSRVPPNTVIYTTLIDCLCKENKIETAISLMNEMGDKGVSSSTTTYNAIFKGLYERNMTEKAFEFMNQMKLQGCKPDYVTMDILTGWLTSIGETERLRCFMQ